MQRGGRSYIGTGRHAGGFVKRLAMNTKYSSGKPFICGIRPLRFGSSQ
jgi:hypothetical protein